MNTTTERPEATKMSVREALAAAIKANNAAAAARDAAEEARHQSGLAHQALEKALKEAHLHGVEVLVDNLVITSDARDGVRWRKAVAL